MDIQYEHGVTEEVIVDTETSELVKFAKEQLKPLLESNSAIDKNMGNCVLDLVMLYASQWHSGASGAYCENAFIKLINFKSLDLKEDK